MSNKHAATPPCGHVFHSDHPFYVLVKYEPRPDKPNYVQVMCETIPEQAEAMSAYLAPIDALIDAAYTAKPPTKFYRRISVEEFDPREFIDIHHGQLRFAFQCGYAASAGRLITRGNGVLASIVLLQTEDVRKDFPGPIDYKVNPEILAAFKRTYEHAGLFAYQETFAHAGTWGEQRSQQEVAAAIQNLPATVDAAVNVNQIAVYDPEFRQWHFVPLEVFNGDGLETRI